MPRSLRRKADRTYTDMDGSGSDEDPPTKRQRGTTTKRQSTNTRAANPSPVRSKGQARSSNVLSAALAKPIASAETASTSSCISISDDEEDSEVMSNPGVKRKNSNGNLSNGQDFSSKAVKSSVNEDKDTSVPEPTSSTIATVLPTSADLPDTPPSASTSSTGEPTIQGAQKAPTLSVDAPGPQALDVPMETNEVKEPTLVEKVIEAMKNKGRKLLNTGDVMLIIDENDFAKTIRIKHDLLLVHAPQFANALGDAQKSTRPVNGVHYLAVLKSDGPDEMPVPHPIAIDTLAPVTEEAPAGEAEKAPMRADTPAHETEVHIKGEPKDDEAPAQVPMVTPAATVDCLAAYDSFFRILAPVRGISAKSCKLPSDAKLALPLLASVTAVAERFDGLPVVRAAIKSVTTEWVGDRSLYAAIAQHPEDWLSVAIKLQAELAYKEAFVHLVGRYPEIERKYLPADVVQAIEQGSRELRFRRCEIDRQLLVSTLRAPVMVKPKTQTRMDDDEDEDEDVKRDIITAPKEVVVSQHFEPIKYNTVNLFRDWLGEHIDFIAKIEQGANVDSIVGTSVCDHPRSKEDSVPGCLSVSGFYHLLHKAGDGYLPAEEVIAGWDKDFVGFSKARECSDVDKAGKLSNDQAADVRSSLKALKEQARKMVAELVRSNLQYEGKDGLPYLTCVDARIVPWAEGKGDEEDDMDCD